MKRISFRTARLQMLNPVPRVLEAATVGAIALGLVLSASAKDALSPAGNTSQPTGHKSQTKAHRPWYEIGVASWYGQQFQGRRTATGERFDMNDMTCAHPTLPMGTWVKVTNLRTRRAAYVRVNDRGPVLEGRIVDLSLAAARAVGLRGVGRVKLEAMRPGDPELVQGLMAQVQMPVLFAPIPR